MSGVEDKKLFEYLRKIRKNLADEQGYPPYIVLSDKSLHELTRMKPTTLQAFGLISGIGEPVFVKIVNGEVADYAPKTLHALTFPLGELSNWAGSC